MWSTCIVRKEFDVYIYFFSTHDAFSSFLSRGQTTLSQKKKPALLRLCFLLVFLFVFKIQTETLSYVSDTLAFFASGNKDES